MLEFIVLGQIPGTSFQITYAQVLMLAATLLLASELRLVLHRRGVSINLRKLIDNFVSPVQA